MNQTMETATRTELMTPEIARVETELETPAINPAMPWMRRIEEHPAWPVLSRLPITVAARIPLGQFSVRDLLGMAEGQVFESSISDTEDVPLAVGNVQLGWTEFEVVEQRIALRLTRLV
jgi:flagellar motor switch protein FliN/FliY